MEKPTLIIGTGALAQEALEILSLEDVMVLGFVAATETDVTEIRDIPVLGTLADKNVLKLLEDPEQSYVLALEQPEQRQKLFKAIFSAAKKLPLSLIHPSVALSSHASLASGNLVLAHCSIGADVSAEAHNVIRAGVIIDSGARIGSYCTLGAGAIIGAGASLGDHVTIGTGAVIHPGITLEDEAQVAPGAVVLQPVRSSQLVVGNPAQPLKA
ncbi:MAG: hypothetical protein LW884_01455 [Bacteroidetes bacterium]|nr:hypothetical protein [Bacteroidota bacterium]